MDKNIGGIIMKNIRVLLACGSGASTGFMATSMRKSAKKKGIEADIKARSESEIDKYLSEIYCLLLGPHLDYMKEEIQQKANEYNVPVACISKTAYGRLDGAKALEEALELISNK